MSTVVRGMALRKRRSGIVRTVAGFTEKPNAKSPRDGVRRARLIDSRGRETRVKVDQIAKTYEIA